MAQTMQAGRWDESHWSVAAAEERGGKGCELVLVQLQVERSDDIL